MENLCDGCLLAAECEIREEVQHLEDEHQLKLQVSSCQEFVADEFAPLDDGAL